MQPAFIGETLTVETRFVDDDDNAIIPASAATFEVISHSGALIDSGTGTQDDGASDRWYAEITIPTNAPIPPAGSRYIVRWKLTSDDGERHVNRIEFELREPVTYVSEVNSMVMKGDSPIDSIVSTVELSSFTFSMYNPELEDPIYETTVSAPTPVDLDGKYLYQLDTGQNELDSDRNGEGAARYLMKWVATPTSGSVYNEIHNLYVASPKLVAMIHDVRMDVDKAKLMDAIPKLTLEDWEIAHFINIGMQRLNAAPPQFTGFTMGSLPGQMRYLLLKAACYEVLNALVQAEGQAAFEFQGLAVNLSVDRTQYLSNTLERLNSQLQADLVPAKRLYARSGKVGALHINIGAANNLPAMVDPYFHLRARLSTVGMAFGRAFV